MSSDHTTLSTVQGFLGAMGARNLDALLQHFAAQVDWYIPGNESLAPWLGKRSDKAEIKEFYEQLWPATEPISALVDHLFVEKDQAVVIGEFATRMLATGKVVNSLFHIQLTVKDGLITKYRLLEDTLAVQQALTL